MENKLSKQERIRQKKQLSDVVSGKMSTVFLLLVAALGLIVFLEQRGISRALLYGMNIAKIVFAVLTVLALVRCVISFKNGGEKEPRIFSPVFTLGLAAAALFATSVFFTIAATYTILALIAFAIIFFVYEIYPVDFFISTVAVFGGCIAAAIIDRPTVTLAKDCIILVLFLALLVVCAMAAYTLISKGKIKLGKKTVKRPRGMLPAAVFTCLAVALAVVLSVLFVGYLLYFVVAACIVYFIFAIIYTVKLM